MKNLHAPARDRLVAALHRAGGRMARIDAAREVAPHGALGYGYATVNRAVAAGAVKLTPPLPGRRGMTVELTNQS